MKAKTDLEQIEQAMDTGTVSAGLKKLCPERRKSMANVLDKIRDSLLEARKKGISFRRLAEYLREQKIPVSEFTLRRYLGGTSRRRVRRKASPPSQPGPVAETPPKFTTPAIPSWKKPLPPGEPVRKLPPRLLQRNKSL